MVSSTYIFFFQEFPAFEVPDCSGRDLMIFPVISIRIIRWVVNGYFVCKYSKKFPIFCVEKILNFFHYLMILEVVV